MKLPVFTTISLTLMMLLVFSGCTEKKEKSKRLKDLEKSFAAAQEEFSTFDAKIKAASGDEGLIIKHQYDKELSKSRVERLKSQIKELDPSFSAEAPTEASAHGGH